MRTLLYDCLVKSIAQNVIKLVKMNEMNGNKKECPYFLTRY